MAVSDLSTKGAVVAGNGVGPTTYVCSVATGTVSVADAVAEIQNEGGTIAGIEGTADGSIILVQGGAAPAVSGVTVEATIQQNPA